MARAPAIRALRVDGGRRKEGVPLVPAEKPARPKPCLLHGTAGLFRLRALAPNVRCRKPRGGSKHLAQESTRSGSGNRAAGEGQTAPGARVSASVSLFFRDVIGADAVSHVRVVSLRALHAVHSVVFFLRFASKCRIVGSLQKKSPVLEHRGSCRNLRSKQIYGLEEKVPEDGRPVQPGEKTWRKRTPPFFPRPA